MTGREQRVHEDGEMSQGTDTTLGDGAEQGGMDHDVVDDDATTDSHGFDPSASGSWPAPRTPTGGFPAAASTGGFPATTPSGGFRAPTGGFRAPTGGFPAPTPTGGFPAPRPHPPQHPWADGWNRPAPDPHHTGPWTQGQYYDQSHYADADEAPREGNGAAVTSCVLAILGLLLSLRPLVFGSNAMAPDTYVALAVSVLALVLGVVGARIPRRRPASVVGIALSLVALLIIAVLPTL